MEVDYLLDTNNFVHDEGLDRPSPTDENEEKLRRLIDDAELSAEQQQQLRRVSAHYAVRTAPVPEENVALRNRCLNEAIIQSDLSAYDTQAIENRGVAFDVVKNGSTAIYVNDTMLTQAQLGDAYRFIPLPDQTDLEAVRIAFEQRTKELEMAVESVYSPEEVAPHPAQAQPAIEARRTVGDELKPITAQVAKFTDKILELVGVR